ncbi:hypothetical protein BBO99_00003413 [Phytophthora kernoviae]|uniref:Secreted protein n=2 Tax=Phytophthora kernoviae TaxID=325452 RepID=A0A3R7K623_9STRA|nr:hypothetical protein G195_003781 [Phytophthora kernoviae 00238/432]KAG2531916.1 hypothetical protein JM16_000570 [Phytophthora kernoviae]KAG2532262.1 hypothetical protein JM18_000721 [Phytophthora kernoviae]RLN25786.1 hypothetical protein BBI17_003052 [Phytophthora kernoviae]RLN81814.1 hypothetical protein BBO99_00003413 [Phytophthora kernoviae]
MKVFVPIVVATLALSAPTEAASFVDNLTKISNTDSYHMKPVRMIHARVQSDAPLWNETTNTFGSKYYKTAELQFRGALDTVNTASVEGALMYVQAEGINYNTRSAADRCWRKNGMKYVVFYDIVFTQTNETLAQYADEYKSEYGPMIPMDGGQCTPVSGTTVFSTAAVSLNGNASVPNLGPFIGGESKETDGRAPYPNCWCTRQGLCDMSMLPDGKTCTYNYRILGYVPIDDVVGITAMTNTNTSANYANFTDFCQGGGVEFNATETGVWNASIPFWKDPQNSTANALRAQKLIDAYANLLTTKASTQIAADVIAHMQTLPTVANLTKSNPKCYENVASCSLTAAPNGCKRSLYGQLCTACSSSSDSGCEQAPSNFTFPTLAKATASSSVNVTSAGSSSGTSTSTPTPSTNSSSAAKLVMTVGALTASIGLSFLMG